MGSTTRCSPTMASPRPTAAVSRGKCESGVYFGGGCSLGAPLGGAPHRPRLLSDCRPASCPSLVSSRSRRESWTSATHLLQDTLAKHAHTRWNGQSKGAKAQRRRTRRLRRVCKRLMSAEPLSPPSHMHRGRQSWHLRVHVGLLAAYPRVLPSPV